MRGELYASAGLHIGLLIWLLIGDDLFQSRSEESFEVTGVTIISNAEFDAMVNPVIAPPVAEPEAPTPPQPAPEQPAAELPEPEPAPEVQEAPDVAEAPAPDPEPEPIAPSPQADVSDEVTALLQPNLGDPTAPPSDTPTPEEAPRVAPTPAPAPPPDVEVAPEVIEQAPEEAPSETPEVVEEPTAPEEATTEIVTEAEEPSSAPVASLRPLTRPNRPAPVETAQPAPDPDPAPQPEANDTADAIAAAVAEANETPPAPNPAPAPAGPPLSAGQRDGFRLAVAGCWNVGALSTEALQTVIVVGFEMNRDGTPVTSSIRQVELVEGTEAGARNLYETARRAIIRCGVNGYDLPEESYERWREVEAVFNPEGMRLR